MRAPFHLQGRTREDGGSAAKSRVQSAGGGDREGRGARGAAPLSGLKPLSAHYYEQTAAFRRAALLSHVSPSETLQLSHDSLKRHASRFEKGRRCNGAAHIVRFEIRAAGLTKGDAGVSAALMEALPGF